MRRHGCAAMLVVALSQTTLLSPAYGQNYTGQGVALGGVAGAIAGGIIGHQNHETPEGALIGGAVGAIAGGLIGNSRDKTVAREQMYREQIWQQQQQLNAQRQSAVSSPEIVAMCRSGVSDAVVINHVLTNGVRARLETHDIISLHQQGVSEGVINAMQRAPIRDGSVVTQTVAVPAPQPVIVREYAPPPTVIVHPYPGPYYYRAHHCGPGFHYYHRF